MLTESDRAWLLSRHPDIVFTEKGFSGDIHFTGVYDSELNKFFIPENDSPCELKGLRISGDFKIRLEERNDKTFSNLPALYVEDIGNDPDRHINQRDFSACLCSPIEEQEFRIPEFNFRLFWERLVIPFLYGQSYYSTHTKWPWKDYSHGSVGLLESYVSFNSSEKAKECIQKLSSDRNWSRSIRPLLLQKSDVKGHSYCICDKKDQIRRCHPEAWKGLLKLRKDIKDQGIIIIDTP